MLSAFSHCVVLEKFAYLVQQHYCHCVVVFAYCKKRLSLQWSSKNFRRKVCREQCFYCTPQHVPTYCKKNHGIRNGFYPFVGHCNGVHHNQRRCVQRRTHRCAQTSSVCHCNLTRPSVCRRNLSFCTLFCFRNNGVKVVVVSVQNHFCIIKLMFTLRTPSIFLIACSILYAQFAQSRFSIFITFFIVYSFACSNAGLIIEETWSSSGL